jgi:hypothetical protein
VNDGGPSSGMRVIASSVGNSLPSARTAVISIRFPEHPRLTRGQVAGESLPVAFSKGRRNDDVGQLLTQDLVPAVAEGALRGGIDFGDATFVVDRHDAFERRVQDGGLARLAASQFLLSAFAFVNVDEQVVPADDRPVRNLKRSRRACGGAKNQPRKSVRRRSSWSLPPMPSRAGRACPHRVAHHDGAGGSDRSVGLS